jgi:transcriptional regulator with XRE-family HTH domain
MGGSPKKQAGLRIRRLRRSSRMSQQALAAAVGVHVNTVGRWESTGIEPDHPRLPSIAAALQCTVQQITGDGPCEGEPSAAWVRGRHEVACPGAPLESG